MPVPHIPGWAFCDRESRAIAVLDWCVDNGDEIASIMGYQLAAAMTAWELSVSDESGHTVEASPMDYVHQIRVIAAFLRSRT